MQTRRLITTVRALAYTTCIYIYIPIYNSLEPLGVHFQPQSISKMYTTDFQVILVLLLGPATVLGQNASDLERLVVGRCTQWTRRNAVSDLDCGQVWTTFEAILTNHQLKHLCVMDQKMFDPLVETLFKRMPSIPKVRI
ncbi:uncharacterized protein DEA37_0006699 [Paragonimus westermani]|uniref:Uncharacterized protein n=1 Tax=Paragonimus westermani TaxID=34504 RepID=A0A5J4NEP3_9TREM|nr:uncharacterized protein DEA37_0006699 [Paragonimus westermani]